MLLKPFTVFHRIDCKEMRKNTLVANQGRRHQATEKLPYVVNEPSSQTHCHTLMKQKTLH